MLTYHQYWHTLLLDSLLKQTIFNGEKVRDVAKSSNESKVTRIKAKDTVELVAPTKATAARADKEPKERGGRLWQYLKGSWSELRLVRWTDRKSTWKMTGALVVFTVVFGVIILLLDYLFQFVFKLLIGK